MFGLLLTCASIDMIIAHPDIVPSPSGLVNQLVLSEDTAYDDLAVGVPGENIFAGALDIIYGTASGLSSARSQHLDSDRFGYSVAAGDFNNDGKSDLAVGVPDEDIGTIEDAGAVNILYGSVAGVRSANDQFWHQNSPGVEDSAELFDDFGTAVG